VPMAGGFQHQGFKGSAYRAVYMSDAGADHINHRQKGSPDRHADHDPEQRSYACPFFSSAEKRRNEISQKAAGTVGNLDFAVRPCLFSPDQFSAFQGACQQWIELALWHCSLNQSKQGTELVSFEACGFQLQHLLIGKGQFEDVRKDVISLVNSAHREEVVQVVGVKAEIKLAIFYANLSLQHIL